MIIMTRVIAICGEKRTGKDTISNYLAQYYGYTNVKISEELKKCCGFLFNFTDDQLETDLKDKVDENWNITPREAMQFMGTDVMQFKLQELLPDVGRTFWIKKTIQKIKGLQRHVVISDLRFFHEYRMLKDHFGSDLNVWTVTRGISNNDCHISEKEWLQIPCNENIFNNQTVDDLYKRLDNLMKN